MGQERKDKIGIPLDFCFQRIPFNPCPQRTLPNTFSGWILSYDRVFFDIVAVGHVQPISQVSRQQPNGEEGAQGSQDDAVQAVVLLDEPVGTILELLGRHPRWLNHHMPEIVMTPVTVNDPSRLFEIIIQRGSRKGRHDVELEGIDAHPLQKLKRFLKDGDVIFLHADDDPRDDSDPLLADGADALAVTIGGVECFSDGIQVRFADAFDSDEQSLTAGLLSQLQEFRIIGDFDGALADPVFLQGNHGAEQIPCVLAVRDDVVVHEYEIPGDLFQFLYYVLEGAVAVGLPIEGGDGAVFAPMGAAATGLKGICRGVMTCRAGHQVAPRDGGSSQILSRCPAAALWRGTIESCFGVVISCHGAAVDFFQLPLFDIFDELRPGVFRISDNDSIEVGDSILWAESRVVPASNDDLSPCAEGISDLIGAVRQSSHEGDAYDIGIGIKVERLDIFIADLNLVFLWS